MGSPIACDEIWYVNCDGEIGAYSTREVILYSGSKSLLQAPLPYYENVSLSLRIALKYLISILMYEEPNTLQTDEYDNQQSFIVAPV
jgi:hypothetical protein